CNKGIHSSSTHPNLTAQGNFEGINYNYTSGSPFRHDKFMTRNLFKIKGRINEFRLILKLKRKHKLDYAILSTHRFSEIVFYTTLAKIFGFKTILNHVEFYSGVKFKWSQKQKWINDKLYDNYAPKLIDISLPISEFIINHLKKVAPQKKYYKVPILAEFEKYDGTKVMQEPFYFLFSGAAAYTEILQFIINSFNTLETYDIYLYLAIKGNDEELNKILEYIDKNPQKEKIKVLSTLNEKQLYHYYKNAKALLIPLRPTIQDAARFPHKIGEYLASGNPVISTNYGEIKYYFKDQDTMLIAETYDIKEFADKMNYVIKNREEAENIGKKGKEFAFKNFKYELFGKKITNFLNSISI